MDLDVQQRIAKLEGLLAKIHQRRDEPRAAAVAVVAAVPAEAVSAEAGLPESAPAPAPVEEYDEEVVDLSDEDVVELGDSAPPPPVEEETAVASQHVVPVAQPESEPPAAPRSEGLSWSSVPPQPEPAPSEPPVRAADSEPPAKQDFGLDFEEDDEEPPASSRRPIASSMDEALADAAAREIPLKTPPPESGPQEAVIVPKDVALSDSSAPGAADAEMVREGLPTSAQLGNTVSLEEGGAADFEVDAPETGAKAASEPAPASEDFEIRLPKREAAGTYDASLSPPPEAKRELLAHRERNQASAEQADVSGAREPAAETSVGLGGVAVTERKPVPHANVTEVTGASQRFRPGSFLELLDASLKLGGD